MDLNLADGLNVIYAMKGVSCLALGSGRWSHKFVSLRYFKIESQECLESNCPVIEMVTMTQ